MKLLKYISAVLGVVAIALLSNVALAATSVSWTNPANGSSFIVGTSVAPTGQASGIGTTGSGLDLALVLDSSGSMRNNQTVNSVTKTRAQWQKDAAIALVNNLPTTHVSVAVVEFDSNAGLVRQLSPLLTQKAQVIAAINTVDAIGGTYIGSGIQMAINELNSARHTAGWSQQMVVMSDGSTANLSQTLNFARSARLQGMNVHSVALPGANLGTMQSIANPIYGNGTFVDASTATGVQQLINLFSGTGGTLVGIDHVDITMPDGTFLGSVAVDALGNFQTPNWLMQLGANVFTATAYGTDGSSASAPLTLYGIHSSIPEPGILGLMGLGLFGLFGLRRKQA